MDEENYDFLLEPSNGSHEAASVSVECVICQSLIVDEVRLACGHKYCYDCLMAWSKINPKCPLCSTNFQWIYQHGYRVPVIGTSMQSASSTSITPPHFGAADILHRRSLIYKYHLVQLTLLPLPPPFRRQNIRNTSRMTAFIQREFQVIAPGFDGDVPTAILLGLIDRFGVESREFINEVEEWVGGIHSHEFTREVRAFGSCLLEMQAYDTITRYAQHHLDP